PVLGGVGEPDVDDHPPVEPELLLRLRVVVLSNLGLRRLLVERESEQLDDDRLAASLRAEDRRQSVMEVEIETVQEAAHNAQPCDPGRENLAVGFDLRTWQRELDPRVTVDEALPQALERERPLNVEVGEARSDAGEVVPVSFPSGIVGRLVDGELALVL